jgi:hypothetical protein
LLGTTDEDWWQCGCFAARARKQVCCFVFRWHHQPLCGHRTAPHRAAPRRTAPHRTAQKMKRLRLEKCCFKCQRKQSVAERNQLTVRKRRI